MSGELPSESPCGARKGRWCPEGRSQFSAKDGHGLHGAGAVLDETGLRGGAGQHEIFRVEARSFAAASPLRQEGEGRAVALSLAG